MNYTFEAVPASVVAAMFITMIISIGFPVFLVIFWKKKSKSALSPFFIGMAVFAVVVLVIEALFHQLILAVTGTAITGNLYASVLYGGLAAGVFEESGRLFAMKVFMKRKQSSVNAVMYGIGHGGGEAILLIGVTYIVNIIFVILINSGAMGSILSSIAGSSLLNSIPASGMQDSGAGKVLADTLALQLAPFGKTGWQNFLSAGIERISAILLHIGLSYIVFLGVKHSKLSRYFLAIAIHALVDALSVLLVKKFDIPMLLFELGLFIVTSAFCYIVFKKFWEPDVKAETAAAKEVE